MKKKIEITRPSLESLACVNPDCQDYGQTSAENLYVRKVYGKDDIRYLRCCTCQEEFSERKNTALWNTKIRERKAISIAEHLSEGNSIKGTSRLLRIDPSTVRRLNRKAGQHGKSYHNEKVRDVKAQNLQADERHGFVAEKTRPSWEAELMDVESKFVLSHVQGARNEQMIRELLKIVLLALSLLMKLPCLPMEMPNMQRSFPRLLDKPINPLAKERKVDFQRNNTVSLAAWHTFKLSSIERKCA
jgi:transposase-like protein